jgi:hypothetical protein
MVAFLGRRGAGSWIDQTPVTAAALPGELPVHPDGPLPTTPGAPRWRAHFRFDAGGFRFATRRFGPLPAGGA